MAPFGSPYKARPKQRSTSPLPPPPPPKAIDLNSSTRSTDKETGVKITRRAFHCDVVVEKGGEETASFLTNLGLPLAPLSTLPAPLPPTTSRPTTPSRLALPPDSDDEDEQERTTEWSMGKKEEMEKRLASLIEELVKTERSYLNRIRALKISYADPLREYARDPNSRIIPLYEAKTLFANIDAIVPASAAFLTDLEAMMFKGSGEVPIGDICLRHLKDLKTFGPYRTYLSKQDDSQKTFQEVLKKFSSFGSYIESTKYQTTGIGNIGLRELLMEPVQRIPRYTLLWQTMVKSMYPLSPQRAKLLESIDIASRIAKCEADAQTVRATVMYCLERNVDGFPADLFSNNRDYIDSIDCEDLPAEYGSSSNGPASPPSARPLSYATSRPISMSSSSTSNSTPSLSSFGSASQSQLPNSPNKDTGAAVGSLHCTLFLFDDKLMIAKRQSSSVCGRKVTGLDDVAKLVKTGGGVAVMDKNGSRRDKLSFKGLVNVLEVIATDVGNGDFHLFLERPPLDQSDRWSSRPFRAFSTVHPPYQISFDPVATRRDKLRFVQNLWAAQAFARTKALPDQTRAIPRVLMSEEEFGLEAAGEILGRAKCFWNVWEKRGWESDSRKAKVAIHVDEDGDSPYVHPRAEDGPCMIVRLQPMSGGLCRFSYSTVDDGEGERTVIDVGDVANKIAITIHKFGIFRFKTSANSCPTTPSSAAHRLRPSMMNLDTISRNLFGSVSVANRVSLNSANDMIGTTSSKRTKSTVSRSSTIETNRYSVEMKSSSSHETNKRLSRESTSPSVNMSEEEEDLVAGSPYKTASAGNMGQSEVDLNARLNLARKNSKSVTQVLSPVKSPGRLGVSSIAEMRARVEERADMNAAEASLRAALVSGGSPLTPTAPLRIRNKSPSPTRAFGSLSQETPRPPVMELISPKTTVPTPLSSTAPLHIRRIPTLGQSILSPKTDAAEIYMTSPRQLPSPPPRPPSAPLSPRPQGPRGPAPRSQIPALSLGSNHTRLRIVSGGRRRVSVGRETIPLKGGENESPTAHSGTPTIVIATKRQHSSDQLSPRKRSPSRSPLQPRDGTDPSQIMPDPLKVPSLSKKPTHRRTSGQATPRKISGPLTPRRASQSTIESNHSADIVDNILLTEHAHIIAATEATKRKIAESRTAAKRLKSEVHNLRKHVGRESSGKDRAARLERAPSLPRSPQSRNIYRRSELDPRHPLDQLSVSSRHSAASHPGRHEIDAVVMEECARGIASLTEKVEGHLKQAQSNGEQAVALACRVMEENAAKTAEIERLEAQVTRGKEHREMLKQQLADVQLEVDVIYEAFNTELDGMFNDASLPESEAFQALKRDLQLSKAKRNELALENMKMKRELQEATLKREEWAKILRAQGVLP
ncbi:hypothetical protein P7C73_g4506, partial [Tremellales sp. Uapishka_1]